MDRIPHLHQKQQLRKDIHQYSCPETHILGYIHDKHLNVGISVAREHIFTSKIAKYRAYSCIFGHRNQYLSQYMIDYSRNTQKHVFS